MSMTPTGKSGRTTAAASSSPLTAGGRSSLAAGSSRGSSLTMAPSGIPYGYVPAYLAGSASLVEQLDQELLMVLRDGRHLVGTLRSFDQFSNLILEDTSERRMCSYNGKHYYANIPLGLYVVRGDSMVLLGTLSENDTTTATQQQQVTLEEFEELEAKAAAEQSAAAEDALQWDFDTDLVA